MKNLNELNDSRIRGRIEGHPWNDRKNPSPTHGAFKVQTKRRAFRVLASLDRMRDGSLVEHISISHERENIYPPWDEMCEIKDMFFYQEESCIQFFPKKSEYVNLVNNCFHLWRPINGTLHIGERQEAHEWIPIGGDDGGAECPVCGGYFDTSDSGFKAFAACYHFCPNCGTGMNGGGEA